MRWTIICELQSALSISAMANTIQELSSEAMGKLLFQILQTPNIVAQFRATYITCKYHLKENIIEHRIFLMANIIGASFEGKYH